MLLQASKDSDQQNLSMIFEDAAVEFEACLESVRRLGRVEPITSCAISIETARRLLDTEEFRTYCCTMNELLKTYANHSPRRQWAKGLPGSRSRKNEESIIRQFEDYVASVMGELDDGKAWQD